MRNVFKVYMWPLWLLSIWTGAKNFKDNPIIGSKLLNKMGLHVMRILMAHGITHFRWFLLCSFMPKPYRKEYHSKGYLVVNDFISEDEVATIRAEIAAYDGDIWQMTQGDTETQRFLLDHKALQQAPTIKSIVKNREFRNLLTYAAAKATLPMLYVQRIHNGFRTSKVDPQKNIHSDTFHPTMKAWLFLEDVTADKGPFTYVERSNRLTKKRLRWEYRKSTGAAHMQDRYSEKGSLRATANDLLDMALPQPKGITVTAGTLVIANTNGFHGRGQAVEGASRIELWAYSRHNPFNPLPGFNLPFVPHIKHKIMTSYMKRKDRLARAKGGKASWHRIVKGAILK